MINEIRAELLLTQLYPELDDKWVARHRGTFFRNYSDDAMEIYPDEDLVMLSRNGFLKLLPDAFISDDDELKRGDRSSQYAKLKRRLHLLEEAFVPVDTQRFRVHLKLERAVSAILEMKLHYILKEYFFYDIDSERNSYIAQVAPLLPYASNIRGDISLIFEILRLVTGCDVDQRISDYSDYDTTVASMPMVTFTIRIDGLTAVTFTETRQHLEEFLAFLSEHFMPFDLMYQIKVIGDNDDNILLGYNSWTTTQKYTGQQA